MSSDNVISLYFEGKSIRQRKIDGYFSATDLCSTTTKQFSDYTRLKQTKEYLNELMADLGTPRSILIDCKKGGSKQGSWCHPRIATHLAMWISPKFAVKVTLWIEEWKTHNTDNKVKYDYEINNLKPTNNNMYENELCEQLANKWNARKEVLCDSGKADLVTTDKVIEVKHVSKWKHALGQAQAYSFDFGLNPAVYLFDCDSNGLKNVESSELDKIRPYFLKFNVELLN